MKKENLVHYVGKPVSLLNEDQTVWCEAELRQNFNEDDGTWFVHIPTTGSGIPFFLDDAKLASIQIQNEELSMILPIRRSQWGGCIIG